MNAVILVSVVLRIVGAGYSGALLIKSEDRRFGFLTVMLSLMAVRQLLSARSATTAFEELPGLAVSVLAVLTVYYLSSYVDEERRITDRLRGFEKAVEHAGHAIFLTDTDGTIEYANPAVETVTGYEPDEVVGENPRLWKSGEHDEGFYTKLWNEIAAGSIWDGEIINRRKSGELCWVDMTIAPITDADGAVERYVAVETDVTERKEQQVRIEQQNERLELLNNTNEVLRDVNRDLVAASTREDVEQAVCQRFAASDLFDAAWIGEQGLVDGSMRVRTAAGIKDATLERHVDALCDADRSPIDCAFDDAPVFVTGDDVSADDLAGSGIVVVPLTYQEAVYGVLVIYAAREDAFEAFDRSLFAELGSTVADAISSIQSKQTLGTDDVTELEFRLDTIEDPLVQLSVALDCTVTLDRVALDSSKDRALYCRIEESDPDAVREYIDGSDHFTAAEHLTTYDGTCSFRVCLDGTSVATVLAKYGASIRSLSASDGAGRLTAELSRSNDVRTTVEALTATYPRIELLAQREQERGVETEGAFRARLNELLTPRQSDAAQTAYFSGYFEWPRESSGETVAATMDISQTTFSQHLRAAEKKLFGAIFDETGATRRQ